MEEINFTLVSPSKVGIYASCPWLLVEDSMLVGSSFTGTKWADFGTVCHWLTMERLGCAPKEEPTSAQKASARMLEDSVDDSVYRARLTRCVDLAEKALLDVLGPLSPGEKWISEIPAHDKTLLPLRRSRPKLGEKGDIKLGEVVGFGGSIDLKLSSNIILVDLKFVSKPVLNLSAQYLWQLGTYSFLSGIDTTMILWTKNDGRDYWYLIIDWNSPDYAWFRDKMRKFVERTGHANFAAHAYPIEGPHCEYCRKNPASQNYDTNGTKCPLKHIPTPIKGNDSATRSAKANAVTADFYDKIEQLAAAAALLESAAAAAKAAGIPPPPPATGPLW